MSTYPSQGLQRILVGSTSAVARTTLLTQDGEVAAPTGTVTADIATATGTVLDTDRTTAAGTGLGARTVALTTTECASLDVLQVTWKEDGDTRAVSYHRIVGGFLFAISDLMQRDGMATVGLPLAIATRDTITDLFEIETGAAWSPTYDLEGFTGCRGSITLRTPLRTVRTITSNDETVDLTGLQFNATTGRLITYVPYSSYQTLVGYEHGYSSAPGDLREQALVAANDVLSRQRSGLSDRSRQLQNEQGTVSFSYAGPGHPTGIDSVDAALRRHDHRVMVA